MSQWHKLHWKEEHCVPGGITLRHEVAADGKVHVKSSHALNFAPHSHMTASGFHDLDWSKEASRHPQTGDQMHHVGDGTVDHITLHPVSRPQGVSVHVVWRDKNGNPTARQDAHFQAK